MKTSADISRIIAVIAGIILAVVVLMFPLGYFLLSCRFIDGNLQVEAEINAGLITQVVSSNPEMWRFEQVRLEGLLSRRTLAHTPEIRRILGMDGGVIAASEDPLPRPVMRRSAFIYDAGVPVGMIEISRSLLPLLGRAAIMLLVMLPLGIGSFMVLRTYPLRAIRRTEEALKNTNEFLTRVLESTTNVILVTNTEGTIIHCNERACELSGLRSSDLVGSPVYRLFSAASAASVRDHLSSVIIHSRTLTRSEAALKGGGGRQITVSWSAAPFFQGVKTVGAVISMEDITEFKRMEDDLIRVQKLESLGVLAGGIAHDFNNLLTAIMGNIEMARMRLRPDDKPYTRLVEAERASLRARDLAQQLLTFSKGGAPLRQAVLMDRVISDAMTIALRGANTVCKADLPADLWPVHGDEGQLTQVMSNLIINACQAMTDGGTIIISGENLTVSGTGDPSLGPGRYVLITVSDAGSGIPTEHLPKIFDPYFTSRTSGSGLGLATVHSIIKRHEGAVRVESEVGKGTTFRIYLPASSGAISTPDTSSCLAAPGAGRVLVMDDEEIIRDVAGEMLRHMGYDVVTAGSGEETIELYRSAREEGNPFDAVIMDLTVPNGMGGRQTMEMLLEIDPKARVVVSSGYSTDPVMADYRSYGFRAVVSKPYKVEDLCRTVQKVISNGG